jgi:hypothetical protein
MEFFSLSLSHFHFVTIDLIENLIQKFLQSEEQLIISPKEEHIKFKAASNVDNKMIVSTA